MTPGIPGTRLPPRQGDVLRVEAERTPQSLPPGALQVRGKGWSANVPMVLVTALLSAVGARLLPTQTSTDAGIERAQVVAERHALEDERFRQEVRTDLAAIRQQVEATSDKLGNRMAVLEAKISAQRP